jgi:hypothetical protein
MVLTIWKLPNTVNSMQHTAYELISEEIILNVSFKIDVLCSIKSKV